MLRTPVMRDSPIPISAYSMPVANPLRIWPTSSGIFTGRRPARPAPCSQRSDVLAGGVLRRERCRAGGDDIGEVHGALHRVLLLAAHEEVRPQRLMRLRIHAHAPHQ